MARYVALAALAILPGLPFWLASERPSPQFIELAGQVRDEYGPVANALVRIKGTEVFTLSDEQGRFRLAWTGTAAHVTASKEGYFIAGAGAGVQPVNLRLHRLPQADSEAYCWIDPNPNPSKRLNCGNCHRAIYDEWQASGHARSAANRRLINLYDGSDWHGRLNVGWSLLRDHPDGADVCSSCHAPTQKPAAFARFDLRDAGNHGTAGVHCDFCHKIQGAADDNFGLTHGRYQLRLLRPDPGRQLFFGPLDDVDRGEDAFSKFQRDSRLCAACHEGVVFGVPVYSTFSEWKSSKAGAEGKSCQSCHMTPTGRLSNIAPGHGGLRRDPATLGNHRFFDGSRSDMLRRVLDLECSAADDANGLAVAVDVRVGEVGHRVPTGYIDRQVILMVVAKKKDGAANLRSGPKLPDFLGPDERGQPGRLYARVLADADGARPAAFWNADPASLIDTRLASGEKERLTFLFDRDAREVRVRLVHRRFWKTIADAKGWPSDETPIAEWTWQRPD